MANRVIFSFVIVLSLINSAAASEGSCNTTAPQNTITVNTLLDLDTDSDAKCSLREAIINANNARCQWFAGLLHGQLWRGCDQHPNTGSHHTQQRSAFRIE